MYVPWGCIWTDTGIVQFLMWNFVLSHFSHQQIIWGLLDAPKTCMWVPASTAPFDATALCRRHRDITGNAPSYLHSLILHLPISIREQFGGLLHHFAGSTGRILSLFLPQLHNKATQFQNYQSEMEAYETCVGVNGERTILITALKAIS